MFPLDAGPCMAGPNQQFSVAGTPADIYAGHLAVCGGSGQASLPYLITPFEVLNLRAAQEGSMLWWIMNNTYTAAPFSGIPGGDGGGGGGGGGGFPGGGGNGSFPGGGGNGTSPGKQPLSESHLHQVCCSWQSLEPLSIPYKLVQS